MMSTTPSMSDVEQRRRNLTSACTRPAIRKLSYTISAACGRVMPGIKRAWKRQPETEGVSSCRSEAV